MREKYLVLITERDRLITELSEFKGGKLYQWAVYFGVERAWSITVKGFYILAALVILWLFSYLWKWIIKPIYNNFKPAKKREKLSGLVAELGETEEDSEAEKKGIIAKLVEKVKGTKEKKAKIKPKKQIVKKLGEKEKKPRKKKTSD
jgi:hypothetical protein